jgi:dTDP-4-dehydrorhamnose 3,5-epimerase-like enzyme
MSDICFTKIHEDDRGFINLITGALENNKEINISSTKKGYTRGGCIHRINDEYLTVVSGKIVFHIFDSNTDAEDIVYMTVGDSRKIPVNSPHFYTALTDCVVIEWGSTFEEKTEKHLVTRAIVNNLNEQRESEK